MKKLFKLLFLTLILTACNKKEYRYEIRGRVYIPTSGTNPMHDAIWYTDTINFDGHTIFYYNSDGSQVRINPPYNIIDHKLEK